jgi:hypothetical protein
VIITTKKSYPALCAEYLSFGRPVERTCAEDCYVLIYTPNVGCGYSICTTVEELNARPDAEVQCLIDFKSNIFKEYLYMGRKINTQESLRAEFSRLKGINT